MRDRLAHRGPDDAGDWCGAGVGLGHRRLSIIDLSPAGRQPLANEDGTVWAVFNGEIYNFRELRAALQAAGHRFRSATDTEVLVHLYEDHAESLVHRLRGMFAFAIWDARCRRLLLARDRFGQKPLVYYHTPDGLAFASELRSLLAALPQPPPVNMEALDDYLTYQYVPAPRTIFAGIAKLPPAHYLCWEAGRVRLERYWALPAPGAGAVSDRRGADIIGELRDRLDEAVRLRLVSDVPLGAFLSGGIDSSVIVASMARQSARRIRTFSVGFDDAAYDETRYARLVAARYGTDHRELTVRPMAGSLLSELVWRFGEPFADSSAIPTYWIAREARRHVTVILSGDGSDEQFAGYPRYATNQWVRPMDWVPGPVYHGFVRPVVHRWARGRRYTAWPCRLDRFLQEARQGPAWRNAYRLSHFSPPLKARLYAPAWRRRLGDRDPYAPLFAAYAARASRPFVEQALYADCAMYLPDDLLVKVDMMSMAHGLEVRSPFLDHELAAFVSALQVRWKVHGARTKVALKRLGAGQLPAPILRRRKMGFAVPMDRWLRGELRLWLEHVVVGPRALARGYFDAEALRAMVREHVDGERDWRYPLWNLLVLELWHRIFVDADPGDEPPGVPGDVAAGAGAA